MAHILVVDDDPAVRATVARMLRALGHETREAKDAATAHQALAGAPVTAVLLDIIMPGKSGIELVAEVRARFPAMRMLAMSGGGRTDNRALLDVATSVGADAAIAKPIRLEELKRVLTQLGLEPDTGAGQ